MAKPDWQPKRRDGDRGRSRERNVREPMRDNVVAHPASNRRPNGPRPDNAKAPVAKQGVNGALRAANLRLLLEQAPLREVLALVAEVPLERLEAMSQGVLCPDETAFHIERTLKLPGKWLDGLNKEVPARTLELLKNPDRAGLHDDEEPEDGAPASHPVVSPALARPALAVAAHAQPAPASTQAAPHARQARKTVAALAAAAQDLAVAPSTQGNGAAQGAAGPATGAAKGPARPEHVQAAGKRAATARGRTAAATEVQLPLTEMALPSQPGPNETSSMATPELRRQNLTVLLEGKGAKSALARILHAKPPYVTAMLSGRKKLDKELCQGISHALGLPNNWFEAPRAATDIPAATLQRLAPLRDAAPNLDTARSSVDTAEEVPAPATASSTSAAATSGAAESKQHRAAAAGAAEGAAATRDAGAEAAPAQQTRRRARSPAQRGGQQSPAPTAPAGEAIGIRTPEPVRTALPAQDGLAVQPAAQEPAPASRTDVLAPVAAVLDTPPTASAASTPRASLQAADFTPVLSQPLVIEGGLAPITEALIKILVLKARQGALSEDKAFELLGAVRLL